MGPAGTWHLSDGFLLAERPERRHPQPSHCFFQEKDTGRIDAKLSLFFIAPTPHQEAFRAGTHGVPHQSAGATAGGGFEKR